jgi:hypothetical protein
MASKKRNVPRILGLVLFGAYPVMFFQSFIIPRHLRYRTNRRHFTATAPPSLVFTVHFLLLRHLGGIFGRGFASRRKWRSWWSLIPNLFFQIQGARCFVRDTSLDCFSFGSTFSLLSLHSMADTPQFGILATTSLPFLPRSCWISWLLASPAWMLGGKKCGEKNHIASDPPLSTCLLCAVLFPDRLISGLLVFPLSSEPVL